jgi:hypothetical protein
MLPANFSPFGTIAGDRVTLCAAAQDPARAITVRRASRQPDPLVIARTPRSTAALHQLNALPNLARSSL